MENEITTFQKVLILQTRCVSETSILEIAEGHL